MTTVEDRPDSRENLVFMSKLCEECENFEEMIVFTKKIAQLNLAVTIEERNLLSIAYKNRVVQLRNSWRVISALVDKAEENKKKLLEEFKEKIEGELQSVCEDILDLLDKHLIVTATGDEPKIFFYKMKADYYRYIAEFSVGSKREEAGKNALKCYTDACDLAKKIPITSDIRLGLNLNFSVFYYEILGKPEKAIELARDTFDAAISELDSLTEEAYRNSTLILQLIKDNLDLWCEDDGKGASEEKEGGDEGKN